MIALAVIDPPLPKIFLQMFSGISGWIGSIKLIGRFFTNDKFLPSINPEMITDYMYVYSNLIYAIEDNTYCMNKLCVLVLFLF